MSILLLLLCAAGALVNARVVLGDRSEGRRALAMAPSAERAAIEGPNAPAVAVKHRAATDERHPRSSASVFEVVHIASAEIATALRNSTHPDLDAFHACRERMHDDCRSRHTDVVNMALQEGGVRRKLVEDGYGLRALIEQMGAKEVATQLANVLGLSSDPDERLASVLLLYFETQLEAETTTLALPESAYRDLADKPVTEARFVGELHRSHPPATREAADAFVALARSNDDRARTAAFAALGHAHTADELLEALRDAPLPRSDWHAAAHAVAICGTACSQGLVQLVSHPERGVRMAAYESIGLAPDGEYQPLVALTLEHAPADANEEELAARHALLDSDQATQQAPLEHRR